MSDFNTQQVTVYANEVATLQNGLDLAVTMLEAIRDGKSFDSAEYLLKLAEIRVSREAAKALNSEVQNGLQARRAAAQVPFTRAKQLEELMDREEIVGIDRSNAESFAAAYVGNDKSPRTWDRAMQHVKAKYGK